ncbi:MAG: HAD family hydrolase [Eubacteriales bacterium]
MMKTMVRDTVFFDLDGTLLPLDMDAFMESYMQKVEMLDDGHPGGVSQALLHQAFQYMMSDTHPGVTNKAAFFGFIKEKAGVSESDLQDRLTVFYGHPFDTLKAFTRTEPISADVVKTLKAKGYRLILATNPVFPRKVTDKRIAWAGLNQQDFEYITAYENASSVKPHLSYYREILSNLGLKGEQCYMVGNSVKEDLCAAILGFEVYLLTDYLIGNIDEAPECEKGNYSDLKKWAEALPPV